MPTATKRPAPPRTRLSALRSRAGSPPWLAAALGFALASCHSGGSLPTNIGPRAEPASAEEEAIEEQEVCVGSTIKSAGELADTLYYRAVGLGGGKIAVGYYVFFSEERPWGDNWLTWSVLPALGVDLVYSRALLVLPGLQRAIYGKGDIEGVEVEYEPGKDGALSFLRAFADDGHHQPVTLERADAFAIDPTRPTFYTDVWSHQLGARGARSASDLVVRRCYAKEHIRPLPEALMREFNLAERAPPAHVERLAEARPLTKPGTRVARTGDEPPPALPVARQPEADPPSTLR